MRSQDSEKLILVAGIAVLSVSLAVPAFQKFAEINEVRDVASRVVDVPRRLMTFAKPGKTLSVQVQHLVDGLSPDAALAEGKVNHSSKPAATPLMSAKKVDQGERADAGRAVADAVDTEEELTIAVGWTGSEGAKPQVRQDGRQERKSGSWTFPTK